MFFFTVERGTVQARGPFAALFRDLLLQRSFLEVHQVGPLQCVHELQFLLFAQHDAGAGLANHLEAGEIITLDQHSSTTCHGRLVCCKRMSGLLPENDQISLNSIFFLNQNVPLFFLSH